jgi:hypothetical protein
MDASLFSPDLFAVLAAPPGPVGAEGEQRSAILQDALLRVGSWLEFVAELEFADETGPPPLQTAFESHALRASIGDDGEARVEVVVAPDDVAVRLVIPSASAYGLTSSWRGLRARMLDGDAAQPFLQAAEALPDRYRIGPLGDTRTVPASLSPDYLRRLLDEAEVEGVPLAIDLIVPREEILARIDRAAHDLETALLAIAPLYHLVVEYSSLDDAPTGELTKLGPLTRDISGERLPRSRGKPAVFGANSENISKNTVSATRALGRSAGATTTTRRERSRTLSEEAAIEESLEGALSTARVDQEGEESEREADRGDAEHAGPFVRRFAPRSAVRVTVRSRPVWGAFDTSAPIEGGHTVYVLAGVFEGKQGVVQELDGRGGARVFLGLFATTIPLGDLARARDGRPALGSSHRRHRR